MKTLLDAKSIQKSQNFTESYENVEPRENRPNGQDLTLMNIENFTNYPPINTTKPPDFKSSISLDSTFNYDRQTTNPNCKF